MAFDGRQRDLAARVHAPVLTPELAVRARVRDRQRQPRQAFLERRAVLAHGALAVERDAVLESRLGRVACEHVLDRRGDS